jgi:hypothetical protein
MLTSAYDAAAWESFAVAEVGAAAALAGLLVVAASINIERILGIPSVVARLGGTLALFTACLVAGVLLLIPGLHPRAAGLGLTIIGTVSGIIVIRPRALRRAGRGYQGSTTTMTAVALAASALIAASGIAYALQDFGGLYWLAAGTMLAFLVGLGNAWVALIEILR